MHQVIVCCLTVVEGELTLASSTFISGMGDSKGLHFAFPVFLAKGGPLVDFGINHFSGLFVGRIANRSVAEIRYGLHPVPAHGITVFEALFMTSIKLVYREIVISGHASS